MVGPWLLVFAVVGNEPCRERAQVEFERTDFAVLEPRFRVRESVENLEAQVFVLELNAHLRTQFIINGCKGPEQVEGDGSLA